MKAIELHESRMAEADDIFNRAEALAFDEAADQRHGVSGDRVFAIAKQLIHNEIRDPAVATAMIDLMSDRVHQLYSVRESEGEVLPRETGTADRLAAQLLRSADGDRDVAEKMAHGFLYNLIQAIDKEAKFTGMKDVGRGRPEQSRRNPPRQRPAKGYDQPKSSARPTFSEFA